MSVHFLVPAGFAERPSGGNVYDRRVRAGLVGLGWDVVTHEVTSSSDVASVLPAVPDDALVLVDSLVASWAAVDLLAVAHRVRLVSLVHMAFESPGERELLAVSAAVVTTSAVSWSSSENRSASRSATHRASASVEVFVPLNSSSSSRLR